MGTCPKLGATVTVEVRIAGTGELLELELTFPATGITVGDITDLLPAKTPTGNSSFGGPNLKTPGFTTLFVLSVLVDVTGGVTDGSSVC